VAAAKTTKQQAVPSEDDLKGVQAELDELYGDKVGVPKDNKPPRSNPETLKKVMERFKSPEEVRERALNELRDLGHGFNPAKPPVGYEDDAGPNRDMTKALIEIAQSGGAKVYVLAHKVGLMEGRSFVKEVATKGKSWIDNPLVNNVHGVSSHLIQDIVVTRAFKRAGINMTSQEFRVLIGQAIGNVRLSRMKSTSALALLTGGKEISTADMIWRATYDSFFARNLNRPEDLATSSSCCSTCFRRATWRGPRASCARSRRGRRRARRWRCRPRSRSGGP
jgi:hypothetical protein